VVLNVINLPKHMKTKVTHFAENDNARQPDESTEIEIRYYLNEKGSTNT